MKKNGYLFIVVALTAIALIGFHATAFGADCTSICQNCHTAESAQLAHPVVDGAPVMCIECHQQNFTSCVSTTPPGSDGQHNNAVDIDIVAIACKGCHGLTPKTCGPYLSNATSALYSPLMHSGSSITLEPIGATPVEPENTGCDRTLEAQGVLSITSGTVGNCSTDSTGLQTCNIGVGGSVDIAKTANQIVIVNTVWWGDGNGLDTTGISHTYNNIGRFQGIQTVRNACGFTDQKVFIVNVSGGSTGKGTLSLSSTGTIAVSYNVYKANNSVSITSGEMPRDVILDADTYDIKVALPSGVVPGSTTVGTCSTSPVPTMACYVDTDCPRNDTTSAPLDHYPCSTTITAPSCTWTAGGTACIPDGAITCPDVVVPVGGTVAVVGTCSP